MLNTDNKEVRRLLLCGNFGLEKEMLRVTADGMMAHSAHPFAADEPNITRDFCENQVEINTPIFKSAGEVVDNLAQLTNRIEITLSHTTPREWLWQYSNPPYLKGDDDIPVARFSGEQMAKTTYRNYLSNRYGRHFMTLSGIHFNYSLSGDLLRANYNALTGLTVTKGTETEDYRRYQDRLYLDMAANLVEDSWIMTVLTAASPVADGSLFALKEMGTDLFCGIASLRCSKLGYWNDFTPVLDYTGTDAYADSVQRYVDCGLIAAPSELYYPIRLKPRGENTLSSLRRNGVNHIELRMIDLNPLRNEGVDLHDVIFAQLLTVWDAAKPAPALSADRQILCVANFKSAALYDLDGAAIVKADGTRVSLGDAARELLDDMRSFFVGTGAPDSVIEVIDWQRQKIDDPAHYRYADIVRQQFAHGVVARMMDNFRREGGENV